MILMKVTVGIPFYNSSKLLKPLLISLINQTYKDFHIVFVDNNSTDDSISIIKEFLADKVSFEIVQEEKQGIAYCRNKILDLAQGIVIFVDSDDVLHPDYIKTLALLMNDSSMAVVGTEFFKDEIPPIEKKSEKYQLISGDDFRKSYQYTKDICLWNKAFDIELIKRNNIRFNEELTIGEDADFVLEYGQIVQSVKLSESKLYFYRESDDSTYGKFIKSDNGDKICNELIEIYKAFKSKLDRNSEAYVGCVEFQVYYMKKMYQFLDKRNEKDKMKALEKEIKSNLKDLLKTKNINLKIKVGILLKTLFLRQYLRKGLRK